MKIIMNKTKDFFIIILFCHQITLAPQVEKGRKYFSLIILISIISIILPFLTIYLTSEIIGVLTGGTDNNTINHFSILCVAVFLIGLLAKAINTFQIYCNGMYQDILNSYIRVLMMEKSAELDVSFFDSPHFYNEMRDATNNAPLITHTVFQAFDFMKNFIQFILAAILMSRFSLLFTIFMTISIIPHVIFQRNQLDALYNWQRGVMSDERKLYYLTDILYSKEYVKDVKLFNLFPFIKEKFTTTWSLLFSAKRKLSHKYTVLVAASNFFPELIIVLFMFSLGIGVIENTHLISDYSYYYGIAGQVMACMYMIVFNYGQLMDGKARIENYRKFMKWSSTINDDGDIKFNSRQVKIEFRNVSFRYSKDAPFALKNVSFIIQSPDKTAIVGVNGSGKSSIIKLMMRLYDPTEGEILLNDINICKYTIESIRMCFSTMFQEYPSYAFDVRESVSISNYDNAEDINSIKNALHKADAWQFISKFTNGLATYLTRQYDEAGVELSGGEWQKISAARTFFRETPIMILDEPSATLDAESEDKLFRQLEMEYSDKCAVLISHRLSNVIMADQILVLDAGKLIERGTHMELLRLGGKYAELFNLQAGKYNQVGHLKEI